MNIPTPEELDYYQTSELETIKDKIIESMKSGVYSITPEFTWKPFLSRLMTKFQLAGWDINVKDFGSKSQVVWVISPRPKADYDR